MRNDKLEKKNQPKTASKLIKAELLKRDMNYFDLQKRLAEAGVNEPIENIRNKIARGTLNTIFFLQCLRALEITQLEINEEIDNELFCKTSNTVL